MILSSSKAEETEAASQSIVKATSWMEWWTFAMKSLALQSTKDSRLVHRLSLAGTRCQLLVAKTASTLWANVVLKRRDAVLAKVKDFVGYDRDELLLCPIQALWKYLSWTEHYRPGIEGLFASRG